MEIVLHPEFWIGLLKIIWVNLLLSGDNAVVIALAARSLPPRQQKKAILFGSGAAIVLRIVLTIFAVALLTLPYLKLIGGALLLWIGVQLLLPEEGDGDGVESSDNLMAAIKTILIADLVMSLDNVLAVAAAAESGPPEAKLTLLVLGLAISIPIVIFGSTLMLRLMERWPIIITIGAALLGWIAGEMMVTDPSIVEWVNTSAPWLHSLKIAAIVGAAAVIIVGTWFAKRKPVLPENENA
jgi:YjbE family integral membrane protein